MGNARCSELFDNYNRLKVMVEEAKELDTILWDEDEERDTVITSVVDKRAADLYSINLQLLLRRGSKGYENITDMELVDSWLKHVLVHSVTVDLKNGPVDHIDGFEEVESALKFKIDLYLRLAAEKYLLK